MQKLQKTGQSYQKTTELPLEWKEATLEDISEEIYRYPTYYDIEYLDDGIPEVRGELINENGSLEKDRSKYRFISDETSNRFIRTKLREGDFVLSVRGTIGKVAVVHKEIEGANITANLMRISPKRNVIYPLYLKYSLMSEYFQTMLNNLSPQTKIKTIQAPLLKSIKLYIPPLSEQQKIASILSRTDGLIQKTDQVIEQTQRLKKGLMQKLLTKGIGHAKFKKTSIGETPEEWQTSTIGNECKVGSGGTPSRRKPENFKGNIPWVRTTELNYNLISKTEEMITESALKDSNLKLYPKGTFLIAMIGLEAEGTRGKCALLGVNAAVNQNCAAIQTLGRISPEFLFYYYQLLRNKKILSLMGGTKRMSLNQDLVRSIEPPIPPLKEQERICHIISSVSILFHKHQECRSVIQNLKEGLMQKLLTGKIRVKV